MESEGIMNRKNSRITDVYVGNIKFKPFEVKSKNSEFGDLILN